MINNESLENNSSLLVNSYASIGRRFVALFLDGLILTIPCAIAGNLLFGIGGLVVWFFYAPVLEASEIRATLGKHLMGIQVTDEMGRRISFRASLIRNLLKFVSGALLLIGFFFAIFTKKKQTLHDLLADTVVVYGRSERPIADAWSESIRALFSSSNETGFTPAAPKQSSAESISTELERLQALREKGALSEDEFQKAKRKVLGDN